MKIANIFGAADWFKVLQTTERSQSAVMTLEPGGASGDTAEAHPHSDQILIVLEGEVRAEVGDKAGSMKSGDVVTIPAGTKHRFSNPNETRAVTLSVYAPPAYPPEQS